MPYEKVAYASIVGSPTLFYEDDIEEMEEVEKFNRWVKIGQAFYPELDAEVSEVLNPGCYEVSFDRDRARYCAIEKKINCDEMILINKELEQLVNKIVDFQSKKELYKSNNIAHKRSYLLCGPPGTGKTSHINIVIDKIIKEKGLVFTVKNPDNFFYVKEFVHYLKKIEPERQLVIVIEDVDELLNNQTEAEFINTLDGTNQLDSIIYLMTTNKIEEFPERMLRPSRIDEVYEIMKPKFEHFLEFFTTKKVGEELAKQLSKISEKNDFSMSQAKELFISVVIQQNKVETAVKNINDIQSYIHKEVYKESKKRKTGKIGEF